VERLAIGALSWRAQNQFDGQLDDIRIHNRALNSEEIEAMMNDSTAPRIKLDNHVWSTGRTKFKIQQDGLHTVPEARKGFPYGVDGRGPMLSTHLGDESWKDYVMDFDFLVKQASPKFNLKMPADWAGIHFLFRVQNLRENWLEKGITAYRLSFLHSGEWEFHRLHNIR
jgi:hypothetical protein